MIITDAEGAGPATLALAGMIRKHVKAACADLANVT
jgi:hypothetical protein